MKKLSIILLSILVSCNSLTNEHYVLASKTNCCHIKVQKVSDREAYLVTYVDYTDGEETILVQCDEAPEEGMTEAEAVQLDLEALINAYQEVCYKNH